MNRLLLASAVATSLCCGNAESITVEDFVKIRCSIDNTDTFYWWTGSIFAYLPQQKPVRILGFVGYNVGRCEQIDGQWWLITRELSYYLDPKTNEKIDTWKNPFTGETVNVVHVANDPVNNKMYPTPVTRLDEHTSVINSDFPLFYDNPLHANASYYEYCGDVKYYEGGEFFKFYYHPEDLKSATNAVNDVPISWTRTGQVPWSH
jgi:hypothetical protein